MRSMWKGHVRISLVTFPVRIYKATDDSEAVSFNQLHAGDCGGRIGLLKRCKKCEQTLASDQIVKGYEYDKDAYVVISDDDLAKVKLESTKIIEVTAFVNPDEVPTAMYSEPYFIGPDADVALTGYALLMQMMKQAGKVAVGSIVLRDREEIVLLSPEGNGIMLYKLRYRNELRSMGQVPQVDRLKSIRSEELALGQSLVESMIKPFGEIEITNRYNSAVLEIIEAKRLGKDVIVAPIEVGPPPGDVMAALRASIDKAKAERKAA